MKNTLLISGVFLMTIAAGAEEQFQPLLVHSLMGLGQQKNWSSVTNAAYALNVKYDKWTVIRPAPGSGRLGTVAVGAADQIFLFGGFVLDPSGLEQIIADLSIYDPVGL